MEERTAGLIQPKPISKGIIMIQILVKSRMGRVILHTVCAARDHHWAWHWRGIVREIHQDGVRGAA